MRSLLAALVLLPALAFGQADPTRVSLDARGDDVREVLATIFAQVHKPYALDASIKGKLYVALDRMPYAKALDLVLSQAGLVAKDRDGVTYIEPAPKPVVPIAVRAAVEKKPIAVPTIGPEAFARRVTTRLTRAPLATVFAAMAEGAKVEIVVDPSVPAYRVDAFFLKTSLRYALDRVCRAAGLRYEAQGGVIKVVKS